MGKAQTEISFLKVQSTQLNIPFANLLTGFVAERLMKKIATSYYRDHFILKDYGALGLDAYRRKVSKELTFYYDGMFDAKNISVIMTRVFEKNTLDEIVFRHEVQVVAEENELSDENNRETIKEITVYFTGSFGEWEIPFALHLFPYTEQRGKKETELALFTERGEHISFFAYDAAGEAAEDAVHILEKLEFLDDMKHYLRLYRLLGQESISGRILREKLAEQFEKAKMMPDEQRMALWQGYLTYPYMKKRWTRFARKTDYAHLSWEQLMKRLIAFLLPVCDAIRDNEIFLKDWMPELERYL